jgi:hypothetical protein
MTNPKGALWIGTALVTLWGAAAQAQDRIYLQDMPDLALYAPAAWGYHQRSDADEWSLHLGGGLSGWFDRGPAYDGHGAEAAASLGAAWRADAANLVHLRSDLAALYLEPDGLEARLDARGHHRARGLLTLDQGDIGLAVEARHHLLHVGERPYALLPVELGPAPLVAESAKLSIFPLFGGDESFSFPLRYRLGLVNYQDGLAPIQRATTHELSSGLGLIPPRDDEFLAGSWELVGVSWSRTEFSPGAAAIPAPVQQQALRAPGGGGVGPHPIERVDLHLLKIDEMVLDLDDALVAFSFSAGGSWLWQDGPGGDSQGYFTSAGSVVARFPEGHIGFSFSQRGGWSPDGERLAAVTRLELDGEILIPEFEGAGLSARAAWQAFGGDAEAFDPAAHEVAFHTSWWWSPARGARLGLYHLARYGQAPLDPVWSFDDRQPVWGHELGVALRYEDNIF